MRKIIFMLIPVGMLFSGFKKIVPDPVEKPYEVTSVSSSNEQRLQDRVKVIKQFINTNSICLFYRYAGDVG